MQVDGIRVSHVVVRQQAELLAHTDTQDSAVHEDQRPRMLRGDFEYGTHALVPNGIPMHRRKQADALEPGRECRLYACAEIARGRVDHEVTVEPFGMLKIGR